MANEFGMQYPDRDLPRTARTADLGWPDVPEVVEDIFGGFFGGPAAAPAARAAGERIQDYFRVALAERQKSPRDPKRTWSPGCSLRASTTSRFRTKTCSRSV